MFSDLCLSSGLLPWTYC